MQQRLPSHLDPPIAFAHRGARAHAPENTIEAFQLALRLGATGLESDVWVTSDGVAVLDHDGVSRRGLRRKSIADTPHAELPDHMPTVGELFDACGTGFEFSLDVKDPAAYEPTVDAIRRAGDGMASRSWLCDPHLEILIERPAAIEIETLSDLDAEQLARGGTSRNERAGKSRPASSAPRSVPVAPPATVARTPPIPSPNATAAENAVPSPSVETADPAPITIADGAGIPPVAPSSKPDPAPAVDSRSADDGAASDLWRGRYEPAFAGALPAPTAVRAIAAMVDGRPAPLPRPGYVAGLQIVGIASGLRFAAGSAELLPGARPVLAEIADELREHPEARIAIMAHTDDLDDAADDLALSVERAASVLEGLVELGVERPRLVAKGYGRTLPLVQSVTSTDRARNRRVELRVLR